MSLDGMQEPEKTKRGKHQFCGGEIVPSQGLLSGYPHLSVCLRLF